MPLQSFFDNHSIFACLLKTYFYTNFFHKLSFLLKQSPRGTPWRRWCLRPATFLKKRLWHRCFPANFTKFLRTPFLQNWLLLFLPFFLQISLYICFVQVFAIFLEYVPLNTPSLITSVGVLPVPKSISCKQ